MYGVRDALGSVRLETAPTMTHNVVEVEFLGKRGVRAVLRSWVSLELGGMRRNRGLKGERSF